LQSTVRRRCYGAADFDGAAELPDPRIDRPALLRRTALGAGAAVLPSRVFAGPAEPLMPRRVFFENPEYRNVKIPVGRHRVPGLPIWQ
jgi:hypothetical protein